MKAKEPTIEQYLYQTAHDSYKDMCRQISNARLIVGQQAGWRLYMTFRGLKTAKIMSQCSEFTEQTSKLFSDNETMLEYADYCDLLEIVREYDDLLAKYKEHVIKLFDLAFTNSTVDSEERFNAHCCGGHIL